MHSLLVVISIGVVVTVGRLLALTAAFLGFLLLLFLDRNVEVSPPTLIVVTVVFPDHHLGAIFVLSLSDVQAVAALCAVIPAAVGHEVPVLGGSGCAVHGRPHRRPRLLCNSDRVHA